MILDQLIKLARGGFPRRRDLSVVARKWANISDLNKDDPYRLRYGEIIGKDWREVDRKFWEYACKDPIATYFVYDEMTKAAREIIRSHRIPKQTVKQFGLLTEREPGVGLRKRSKKRSAAEVFAKKKQRKKPKRRPPMVNKVIDPETAYSFQPPLPGELSYCIAGIGGRGS